LGLPLDVLGAAPEIRRLIGGLKAAEAAYRDADLGGNNVGFLVTAGSEPGRAYPSPDKDPQETSNL
jgi:hypothetical protein